MRKLFIFFIIFICIDSVLSQSYSVYFNQIGNTSWSSDNNFSDTTKVVTSYYYDSTGSFYICGYYPSNFLSFVKKYDLNANLLSSFTFDRQDFLYNASKSGIIGANFDHQIIIAGQKSINKSLGLRIVCLDSNLNKIWDVTAPDNTPSSNIYISHVICDSENNVYLTGGQRNLASGDYDYHGVTFKFSEDGVFLWRRDIANNGLPWAGNQIFKINANTVYLGINNSPPSPSSTSYTFFELDKATGNIIRSHSFNPGQFYAGYQVKSFGDYFYLGVGGYRLYKINSNWDTIWSRNIPGSGSFTTDINGNPFFRLSNSIPQRTLYSYDFNGNYRWSRSFSSDFVSVADSQSIYCYTGQSFAKIGFNNNLEIQSEVHNSNISLYNFLINYSEDKKYTVIGRQTAIEKTQVINFNSSGQLINSRREDYNNDYATDFKYFNSFLYVTGINYASGNKTNTFINKYSTTGALQWSTSLVSNSSGSAKIKNICPSPNIIYGTGEELDTITNKYRGILVGLNTSGALISKYRFDNIFNNGSSGEIVSIGSNGAPVPIISGYFKDNSNRNKIFISRNNGNSVVFLDTVNALSNTNDSIASFYTDQFNYSYLAYNSYSAGLSIGYGIIKINPEGLLIYSKYTANPSGAFIKKFMADISGFGYALLSSNLNGNYDLITQKLDTNGSILWTDTYNNPSGTDDIAADMVMDLNLNVIVTNNFINSTGKLDAFIMKLSNNGERLWNKIYNSPNKFVIKRLSTDDLRSFYLSGISTDEGNSNKRMLTIQYDKDGVYRNTTSYNTRDTSLLSFSNDFMETIVTNVEGGTKKMFAATNVNKLSKGSDILLNFFNAMITNIENENTIFANGFNLSQNYPNPFNPSTLIKFSLPYDGVAKLSIFDINGREIAVLVNKSFSAGEYDEKFDGSKVASGIYFYKLEFLGLNGQKFSDQRKFILLK
jgi:hypothetical protein